MLATFHSRPRVPYHLYFCALWPDFLASLSKPSHTPKYFEIQLPSRSWEPPKLCSTILDDNTQQHSHHQPSRWPPAQPSASSPPRVLLPGLLTLSQRYENSRCTCPFVGWKRAGLEIFCDLEGIAAAESEN